MNIESLSSSSPSTNPNRERLHVPRIRSHSLAPKHSKYDYNRRRSELEQSSASINQQKSLDDDKQQPQRTNVPAWFRRRFTLFSIEANRRPSNSSISNYSKQNSFSFDNDQILENYNQQRRPSKIMSLVESFARKFSLRKKKSDQDDLGNLLLLSINCTYKVFSGADYVDPVYETLKLAAETRKMTLSNYLQQRQQTLNKQTSLNSQGSSEHASPKNSRNSSRTEMDIVSTTTKNVTASSSGMSDNIVPTSLSPPHVHKYTKSNRSLRQTDNIAIRHHLQRQLSLRSPHDNRGGTEMPKTRRRVKFDLRIKSISVDNPEYNPKKEYEEQTPVLSHSFDDMTLANETKREIIDDEVYVVLYGYIAASPDDIDLRLGTSVKVIDSSDPDWWRGTANDGQKTGYFPSSCVSKIMPGYKIVRVRQSIHTYLHKDSSVRLSKGQIVIKTGEEYPDMAIISTGKQIT
ncbi:unnamed protein product, partial [Didymodactylos carnosus]